MFLDQADLAQCQQWESELATRYHALQQQALKLDLTRGKPSAEQLSVSDSLDGLLKGNYKAADGTDTRNYGGLDGLPEAKQLGALLLGVDAEDVIVGGNSSLTLMFYVALTGHQFGFDGAASAWSKQGAVKFLCPVPGYDRHFSICEKLGIEMITVPMTSDGPDMDAVEAALKSDPSIKGMWCVPKYSNPTGIVYSDAIVKRIAQLGKIAGRQFRVFWDNAYAWHSLYGAPAKLADVMALCREAGTEDSVIQFASTSKITHAGAGVAFLAASAKNRAAINSLQSVLTIGPDKVNQLRHCLMLKDAQALQAHMEVHAGILRARFETVLRYLDEGFGKSDLGQWEKPEGGYFVSFDARPNTARAIIELANNAGVKLTPAGATFPYGKDPENRNIRIAPSVPTIPELEKAMEVFVLCVKLASVRERIKSL